MKKYPRCLVTHQVGVSYTRGIHTEKKIWRKCVDFEVTCGMANNEVWEIVKNKSNSISCFYLYYLSILSLAFLCPLIFDSLFFPNLTLPS